LSRLVSFAGCKKKELINDSLAIDIGSIVDTNTQSDRCHNDTLGYVKMTAKHIWSCLTTQKGYKTDTFSARTITNILNRLGYTLKKVRKTLPLKRIPETNAIFENINAHRLAESSGTLKISIDTKDNVAVGDSSRGGYSRAKKAVKAADKDFDKIATLVPLGILEIESGETTVVLGNSCESSDFIVDALGLWYEKNKEYILAKGIHTLEMYLDNGPSIASSRTQFINRMMEFACITGLKIHLLYYPPYHSKYNPIERVWAAVEQYWNGTILNTVDKVVNTLSNVKWKGKNICSCLLDKEYEKGISLTKKEMGERAPFLIRHELLPKWDVLILPSFEMGRLFFS
jgi:Rhodopirellula transposase DDE domain